MLTETASPSPPNFATKSPLDRGEAFRSKISHSTRIFFAYWWIPACTVALGLAIQAWISFSNPVSYHSSGRILVSGRITLPESGMFNEETLNFFGTQIELIQSGEVRRRAAAIVQSMHPALPATPVSLQVFQIERTSIFQLSASGQNPDYIKAYLDAIMEEYIALRQEIFNEKSQTTLVAITDELTRVEKELRIDEDALLAWKQENNLSFLKEESISAGGYLTTLNRNLAELESEYNLINQLTEEQNIDRVAADLKSAGFPNIVEDPDRSPASDLLITTKGGTPAESYLAVKRKIYLLQARREQLLEVRQPAHPKVREIEEEVRTNQKLLEVHRKQAVEQFESKRQALAAQIKNTQNQIATWEKKSLNLSSRSGEFERLNSKVERQKNLYDRLLSSVQKVDVNANIQQDILSIMEFATPPRIRIQPLAKELAVGVIFGAAAGIALLLLVGILDDRIVSISEIQDILAEEVIGVIPQVSLGQEILRVHENDNPGLFESFRKLRSWLLFTDWENGPPKSLLITSAIPEEGKSTVSVNLATCFAISGTRTLLIDADLRRGTLHHIFNLSQAPGLGDTLCGETPVEEVIQKTGTENLWLIPRGHYGGRSGEAFLNDSLDHFLKDVGNQFDVIIFDSSPVLAVDETSILAGKVDATFVTIRCGMTSLRMAKRAISNLLSRQAVIGGIVYNAVNPSDYEYPYYNYDYSQHDGNKKKVRS